MFDWCAYPCQIPTYTSQGPKLRSEKQEDLEKRGGGFFEGSEHEHGAVVIPGELHEFGLIELGTR